MENENLKSIKYFEILNLFVTFVSYSMYLYAIYGKIVVNVGFISVSF